LRYVRHLPQHAQLLLVEVDVAPLLSPAVLEQFREELAWRAARRHERVRAAQAAAAREADAQAARERGIAAARRRAVVSYVTQADASQWPTPASMAREEAEAEAAEAEAAIAAVAAAEEAAAAAAAAAAATAAAAGVPPPATATASAGASPALGASPVASDALRSFACIVGRNGYFPDLPAASPAPAQRPSPQAQARRSPASPWGGAALRPRG
ncbi:MAG: hypothetical protein ACK41Y_16525, partial [Paracoccus hibiscisoli]